MSRSTTTHTNVKLTTPSHNHIHQMQNFLHNHRSTKSEQNNHNNNNTHMAKQTHNSNNSHKREVHHALPQSHSSNAEFFLHTLRFTKSEQDNHNKNQNINHLATQTHNSNNSHISEAHRALPQSHSSNAEIFTQPNNHNHDNFNNHIH